MEPEGRRIFIHLTVDENIQAGAFTRKDGHKKVRTDIERMYALFPRLTDVSNRMAGYCSGGEQQMIAIARAMMASPIMLMLDEPSLGLAPLLVDEIFQNIQKINQELDTTVLIDHTGDLGQFDDDGFLFYKGRKPEKELIKPGGENVYPAEVENVILRHPAIKNILLFLVCLILNLWIYAKNGLTQSAKDFAENNNIFWSNDNDLNALLYIANLRQLPVD
jgi:energy-coupling factor transporter ATP-binding protein EcfA2